MKRFKEILFTIITLLMSLVIIIMIISAAIQQVQMKLYPLNYQEEIIQSAEEFGISKNLLISIIKTESGFDPEAHSEAGALGLTQITEETFDWIKGQIAPEEELTFESLKNPAVSIRFGAFYLSYCLNRYQGDVSTAAAAYHSGCGTVDELLSNPDFSKDGKTLSAFPYEQMNNYVNKVNKAYQQYIKLYGGEE